MEITDVEMIEINTHLKLINKSYQKFQTQRTVVETLEGEFQEFFNFLIENKGGDPNKQYQLDLENKQIIEQEGNPQANQKSFNSNNGQNPNPGFSDEVKSEVIVKEEFDQKKVAPKV